MTNSPNAEREQATDHIRPVIVNRRTYIVVSTALMCGVSTLAWVLTGMFVRGRLDLQELVTLEGGLGFLCTFAGGSVVGLLLSPLLIVLLRRRHFDSGLWLVFGLSLATGVMVNLLPKDMHGPHNLYAGYLALLVGAFVLSRLKPNVIPRKPGHCPNCDYDLRGATSNKCPECGATKVSG